MIDQIIDKSNGKVIDKIVDKSNGKTVYEAWKLLPMSGIPPLTIPKCKGVDLADYKIYGNSIQDGTPTPDTPIEVVSVGDKTRNIYDAKTYPLTKGYWINGAVGGTSHENTEYASTLVYIPCANLVGKTITISRTGGSNPGIAFYDKNKTFISGARNASSTNTKITTIIPEGAVYYRFCVVAEYMETAQVEEGNTVTEYEPYGYKIPVKASGVNLHNHKLFNYKETTTNGITFIPLEDGTFRVKGKLVNTGTTTSYRVVKTTAIPIKAGTYHSKVQNNKDLYVMFGLYDKNGKFVANIHSGSNSGNYTVKEDGYIGYCQIVVRSGVTSEIDEIVYPQLSKGTTDYPYQPYIAPITTNIYLNEPLRKLGDYADYIDFENDKVVRNIKKIVLTGGVEYRYTSYASKGYYIYGTHTVYNDANIYNFTHYVKHVELSTHFTPAKGGNSDESNAGNWYINTGYRLRFQLAPETFASDGTVSTLDDINAWLQSQNEAGTPVTFYYITTEPTTEDITLPSIPTHKGTTIIEIDTETQPSNMEVQYYGKK